MLLTYETTAGVLRIYHHTIVTSQSLQHDFYWTKMRPESIVGAPLVLSSMLVCMCYACLTD